ncbi:hypothetical protein [Paenibacillus kobensis]|uniref:hypothetical protein n=1 Tax=Paenibacillus kobensis TaxID=59841 RepID=UPI001FE8831F|nr:hypothetical protein [Paenibacillus kobensis]
MAICLHYELVEQVGEKAIYRFGNCLQPLDGLFEVDLARLISGEIPSETPMSDVVRRLNDLLPQQLANRVFGKIYRYYEEHKTYLSHRTAELSAVLFCYYFTASGRD